MRFIREKVDRDLITEAWRLLLEKVVAKRPQDNKPVLVQVYPC